MTIEKVKDNEMTAALKRIERAARLLKKLSTSKSLMVDRDRFAQITTKYLDNLMTEEVNKLRLCGLAHRELCAAARKVLEQVNDREGHPGHE
jgi:hypothetical protein